MAVIASVAKRWVSIFPSHNLCQLFLLQYYRTVGPLPPRLHAPLWRTPPSSPKSKATMLASPMNVDEENEKDIERHKQEISRHRHNWAPPSTPPKYWSIGFPDTQEVREINREAEEMIEAKKAMTEVEAR